jgi:predicted acyltransferase
MEDTNTTTEPAKEAPASRTSGRERILSVDVLRGFDMIWITGGAGFLTALLHLCGGRLEQWIVPQLEHVEWEGFHFYDLIFPLFVFIVGMSVVFSLQRILAERGAGAAYRRVWRRFLLLYLLGILYYGGMKDGFAHIRLMGVLQRLALTYLFTGILFIHFRLRGLVVAFFAVLLSYWALLSFVPVPGVGHVSFAEGQNWANWVDQHFLPLRKWDGEWDPEGILSTIPAIGSCLLGLFAALLLREQRVAGLKKAACFLGGGAALVGLGYLWGLQFPVIKKIWTSSYVLVAGGYSLLLLGAFYLILDVWKLQRWAAPFVWIGMNPITLYLARNVVDFNGLAGRFVGGELQTAWGQSVGRLLLASVSLALSLLLVRFLFKRKIFLRV